MQTWDAITSRRNVQSLTDRPFTDVVHRAHW
jgi:hypothetical protein